MKKTIMNNFGLKIASVLLAILVWLVVVNIDDPIVPKTIDNVVVKVQNGSYIEDMRKTYRIEENKNMISVVVRGKRSVVKDLTATDIMATADLTQIISMETNPIMVPIRVTCDKITEDNISARTQAIEIEIEELKSAEFIITPSADETKPGKGYEVGIMQTTPEKITISGPESTINKIDKVLAPVVVSNLTQDTQLDTTLRIVDKNQETMPETETQYLRFNDLDSKVTVGIELWKVKNNIKIVADYSGKPADGFKVAEVRTTPNEISIAGSEEALTKLAEEGNTIKIPSDLVVADGAKADFECKIDISEYLPESTKLATDVNSNVIVKVIVLPIGSKEYDILTKDIQVVNKANGYAVGFGGEKITVRVKGLNEDLESLKSENIKASVNLKDLNEGEYTLPVEITLPDGYELVDQVTVTLRLEKTVDSKVENTAEIVNG